MSIISVPRKRAAGNSPAAMVGVSSGLFGGFSNSIPIAPSVPVTLGQIMIAAIAGEDSSANQFITSG
ncbi:MAG: hypothetical protein SF070_18110, partial [Gemmatimonadota bacterium]|nr:hypothetical protein [Gemmatimonadota bacterium]